MSDLPDELTQAREALQFALADFLARILRCAPAELNKPYVGTACDLLRKMKEMTNAPE